MSTQPLTMIKSVPTSELLQDVMDTPYTSMWIDGDIMCCRYNENLHVSLEVAKVIVEARIYFSKGKSYALLIDMRGIKSATKDARHYLATIGAILVKAGALITGSQINRAIGNVFLTIDKPLVPTKLFTDEARAREWLRDYV